LSTHVTDHKSIGQKNAGLLAFIASTTAVFALFLALNTQYVLSDFVFQDDLIYLSRSIFGQSLIPSSDFIPYVLIDYLGRFQSVPVIKLSLLMLYSITAGFCSLLFYRITRNLGVSIGIAVFVVLYPVDEAQIIFVTGSHSTFSTCFIVMAYFLFEYSDEDGYRQVLGIGGAMFFLILASMTSPTAYLTPFLLPIWLLVQSLVRDKSVFVVKNMLFYLFLIIVGFLPLVIGKGFDEHHYSGLVGWTEFSAERVFDNLISAIFKVSKSVSAGGNGAVLTYCFFAFSLLITAVVAIRQSGRKEQKEDVLVGREQMIERLKILAVNSLLVAALTFGPVSILTGMLGRYLVSPSVFALIFLISIYLILFFNEKSLSKVGYLIACIFLIGGLLNASRGGQMRNQYLGGYLATHNKIAELVNKEERHWKSNSQVLLLTHDRFPTPTIGFNHWSSWYLRLVSGRVDLLAVIGSDKWISGSPFVKSYADHGGEYWKVINGRSTRTKMIGFELKRPLYAYSQSESGEFRKVDLVTFVGTGSVKNIQFGGSAESTENLTRFCKQGTEATTFVWHMNIGQNRSVTNLALEEGTLEPFNGALASTEDFSIAREKTVSVNLSLSQAFSTTLVLKSSETVNKLEYTKHFPPMPLLSKTLAIYQIPEGYRIVDRVSDKSWVIKSGKEMTLNISGIEGCLATLVVNDKILGQLGSNSMNGDWSFGAGFKERKWSGLISH
jgi:hypothetical protein